MFKKINLLKDSIAVQNVQFAKALNSNREFGITVNGEIDYEFSNDKIYIFKGKANLLQKQQPLGKGYKISSTFVSVSISAGSNWNEVEDLNSKNALYKDDSAEGVDSFNDPIMEEIGWHSVEFKISYRELVEELEEKCNGTVICIERDDEPYMFNGLGFMAQEDIKKGRDTLREFVKNRILSKLEKDREEYKEYGFSEEELDALNYFQISDY